MDPSHTQANQNRSTVLKPSRNNLPVAPEQGQQGPALGQAAFWLPRHTRPSPILGQLPFLFWLIEMIGPRVILQLGLGDGIGYLALCQAAERQNSGTLCFALEAGSAPLSSDLQAVHDADYSDFSRIIRDERMAASLSDGVKIELLVLGSPLDRDTLTVLHDDVLPSLADGAIVLVLDPDTVLSDQVAGALMVENQFRLGIRPVEPDGIAIEVILYGTAQPDKLHKLLTLQPGQPSWLAMRQAFNRLGQGIVATQKNQELMRERATLQGQKQSEKDILVLKDEIEKARASENGQIQRQAELSASMHDLQEQAEAMKAERDKLSLQIDALTRGEDRNVDAHLEEISELRRLLDEARFEHNERIEDIVALTAKHKSEIEQFERGVPAKFSEMSKITDTRIIDITRVSEKRIIDIQNELAKMTAHRDALLTSTSWKITSPLRRVAKAMRGL